mgnify:CR=1 FL=1
MSNPAVLALASTDAGQDVVKSTTNALKFIFIIGGVLGAGYLANKQYKKWRSNKYLTDNAANPETQIAVMMYNAMFTLPTDMGWFSITLPDGTDEDLLNSLARQDVDLGKVSKAYKIIFDKVLLKDINTELNGSEIQAFFNNSNSTGSDTSTPAENLVPYLKGETVYVRNNKGVATRTGEKQENGAWLVTNDTQGFFVFSEEIGVVYDIKRYANGEIDYIIDEGFFSVGYAVANHRDLINRNPEKNT